MRTSLFLAAPCLLTIRFLKPSTSVKILLKCSLIIFEMFVNQTAENNDKLNYAIIWSPVTKSAFFLSHKSLSFISTRLSC